MAQMPNARTRLEEWREETGRYRQVFLQATLDQKEAWVAALMVMAKEYDLGRSRVGRMKELLSDGRTQAAADVLVDAGVPFERVVSAFILTVGAADAQDPE